MTRFLAALLLAFGLTSAHADHLNAVGIKVLGARPPEVAPVAGQPLETRPPNGVGQKPAFPGQTRAPAVISKTAYLEKVVTHGLHFPWSFAFLPDGRILIAEKPGTMRVVDRQTGKIECDVNGIPLVKYEGDGGLLDVILDPKFTDNRLIYFDYVEPCGVDSSVVVAKAQLSNDDERLLNVTTILHVEPAVPQSAHFGSRLLFDPDGHLFVSLGERFYSPTRDEAQSLYSEMGKILRITTDGHPAPGNPFDKNQQLEDHFRPEIWSYGHRNPQGLAFNPVTGDLWESEHGPQGGDEINLIRPGKNYGWPVIAYGCNYDGTTINGGATQHDGMEQPRYYWDPAIAPSGITFYDGKLIPEWKNNLFVAALAGEHVARLVIQGDKIVGEERLLLDQHARMRSIKEGPDGALWVITDEVDGSLIRISPK